MPANTPVKTNSVTDPMASATDVNSSQKIPRTKQELKISLDRVLADIDDENAGEAYDAVVSAVDAMLNSKEKPNVSKQTQSTVEQIVRASVRKIIKESLVMVPRRKLNEAAEPPQEPPPGSPPSEMAAYYKKMLAYTEKIAKEEEKRKKAEKKAEKKGGAAPKGEDEPKVAGRPGRKSRSTDTADTDAEDSAEDYMASDDERSYRRRKNLTTGNLSFAEKELPDIAKDLGISTSGAHRLDREARWKSKIGLSNENFDVDYEELFQEFIDSLEKKDGQPNMPLLQKLVTEFKEDTEKSIRLYVQFINSNLEGDEETITPQDLKYLLAHPDAAFELEGFGPFMNTLNPQMLKDILWDMDDELLHDVLEDTETLRNYVNKEMYGHLNYQTAGKEGND